jgi:hypothetical protein
MVMLHFKLLTCEFPLVFQHVGVIKIVQHVGVMGEMVDLIATVARGRRM